MFRQTNKNTVNKNENAESYKINMLALRSSVRVWKMDLYMTDTDCGLPKVIGESGYTFLLFHNTHTFIHLVRHAKPFVYGNKH